MELYWLVHINNFDSFISFIVKKFNNFFDESDLYHFRKYYAMYETNYLYLCVDIKNLPVYNILTYCSYNDTSKEWLNSNEYKYIGEYHGRKEKLDRLNIISKL